MSIEGKVVAITGAGRGIGRAVATHLAARGAKVVPAARKEAEIGAAARDIQEAGGTAAYKVTDVTRRPDLLSSILLAPSSASLTFWSTTRASARSRGRRAPGRGVGGHDRREPAGRALQHCRRPADVPAPGRRSLDQHPVDGRD